MKGTANPYEDMLHLPHPVSAVHPRMPMINRAAQFSPFAALTGYDAAILEAARLTEERIELDESRKAVLSQALAIVQQHMEDRPEITVTYFKADEKKAGGAYITTSGPIKKIDELDGSLTMLDGEKIPMEDIFDLEGALFHSLEL